MENNIFQLAYRLCAENLDHKNWLNNLFIILKDKFNYDLNKEY